MPQSESKQVSDDAATAPPIESQTTAPPATVEEASSGDEAEAAKDGAPEGATAAGKKKKSKKKKIKSALGMGGSQDAESSPAAPASKMKSNQLQALLEANPALAAELTKDAGGDRKKLEELVRSGDINQLMTGLNLNRGGKDVKDMASYRFWQTQPVPSFGDTKGSGASSVPDGPLKPVDPERVPKEPKPLPEGFLWVTMDLTDQKELDEIYDLLNNHYVEDDEAMFRFRYSASMINWALKAPGWKKEWHVGVRTNNAARKLVAFISGIPVDVRVRKNTIHMSEVNFLCIHKKLRSKRLAPELIKEVTRRCHLQGIYQAIYTGGTVLPTPVSTCRYYHRSLNWEKLYECGFSPLPPQSTRARQISKYKLPTATATHGLRPMQIKDVDQVVNLLQRYLDLVDLAQHFSKEEALHWFLQNGREDQEKVVWSYVVEDSSKKITDFFSFYCLESSVIGNKKHDVVRAAYMFYYATESAFTSDKAALKTRLNLLAKDALILAKQVGLPSLVAYLPFPDDVPVEKFRD